ncbi:InlB B-repeat-containing protein [uncultured Fibrobacter sp.]|uniref:InlB B-repeat-containing protein n=1 Tax=uncultured Fibrobacter sp. TaxID=261512 RepID=UPI0025E47A28|nr:InlB B-repeat-containing protein [uncultured Fibrobacter sp.]
MKHVILSTLSLLFLATNLFAAAWTGATSEPENMKKIDGKPFYVITNADELAWFAAKVNAGETTINAVLANDIVFGADTSSSSNTIWTTINSFDGIIDGNDFTIYGVYLKANYFIKKLTTDGVLKKIKLKNFKTSYTTKVDASNQFVSVVTKTGTGFVFENYGLISYVANYNNFNAQDCGGISTKNYGTISHSSNYGNIPRVYSYRRGQTINNIIINDLYRGYGGGIAGINFGEIIFCKNFGKVRVDGEDDVNSGGIVGKNEKGGIVSKSSNYSENVLIQSNEGQLLYCIQNTNFDIVASNSGSIKTYHPIKHYYYVNNVKMESTAEKMQTDQFAWVLNTENGTKENSGVWTRGTDCYPTWANEDSLGIHKIAFDDDGIISNRYTNYKGLVIFPENPDAPDGFIFSGWYNGDGIKVKPTTVFTADQTVKAIYTDASDIFWTITFYNAVPADTVLESKSYQHGSIVNYGGVAPTLAPTAKYTYTFKGWDVEPTNAVEDFDYHAVYDSTVRSYAITFNNYDDSKIESAIFEYGKMASCSKVPTRAATAEWKYSHKGWRPALDYVTEAATYTAIYDSSKVEYKVTFMNGTSVIDTQSVAYGEAAVAPTNVTREGYKFVGWNTSFAKVTEALTVKALFEELIIRTVNVVDVDGDKIVNTTVEDGEKYTLPEAPKKEGYTFDAYYEGSKKIGVAGDEISVTANITIIAKYIENPKSSSSQQEITSSSSTPRNDKSSSSSFAKSSSSSKVNSSSSEKIEAIIATAIPQFSVLVNDRSLQISAARIGATYALFDMQGKVLLQGRVQSANFEIPVARSGNYLIRVGNNVQRIAVK